VSRDASDRSPFVSARDGGRVLETANANDAAATANSLASDLEAITADAGDDARARAADAADKVDELSTEVDFPGRDPGFT
jgi:hypothetical protein